MGHGLKALALAVVLSVFSNSAAAVTYWFDYRTPFVRNGGSTLEPRLFLDIDDAIWGQGGSIAGSQDYNSYSVASGFFPFFFSVPFEGVTLRTQSATYFPLACDSTFPDGSRGSCSTSPTWLINTMLLGYSLEFQGSFLIGSLSFDGYGDNIRASSDATGLWTFSRFGSDFEAYNCDYSPGGVCTASGKWRRVPEPGTLALLSLGLLGLGLTARRRLH